MGYARQRLGSGGIGGLLGAGLGLALAPTGFGAIAALGGGLLGSSVGSARDAAAAATQAGDIQSAATLSAIAEQRAAREQALALAQPYTDVGRFTLPGLFRTAVAPIDYSGLPEPRLLEFGGGYSPTTPGTFIPRQYFADTSVQKTAPVPARGINGLPPGVSPPVEAGLAQQQGIQPLQGGGMIANLINQQIASGALTPASLQQAQIPQGIQPIGGGGLIGGLINQIAAANPAPAPASTPAPVQTATQPLFTMEQLQAGTVPRGTFNAGFLGAPTQQMATASGVKPSQIRTMAAPDMQGRPVPPQAPTDFLGGFRALNPPGGPRFDAQGNEIPQAPVTMIGSTPVSADDMARLRETRDYLGSWRQINAGRTPTGDQMLQGPGFGMTPAPTGGQLLPALPSVTPQPVGPLPGLRPEVTGLPGLAPIAGGLPGLAPVQGALPGLAPVQGALPGVSYTAPTGLPALTPTQGIGLPGLNIVGPEQLPGLPTPVQPELPRVAPIAQVGPQLGPILPTDLPTIGANIQQDSLFQALKREAIGGIEASAAARGKLFSGTTPQAIAERVQNLALARAGDIQAQNIAARQQLMGEAQQQFGQQLAGRQLGGTEAERAFAQQVQARQIAGAEGGQAFQQALALRELAGSEAARQFGQQLAARQQLMGEGGQVFGETVTARQLGSAEAQQAFAQQMALRQLAGAEVGDIFGRSLAARQLAGAEVGDVFGRSLAARQLAGAETGDIFGRSLAAQQQAAALQGQTFGQSLAARQALLAQQQQQQATAMALRSQLIGERGQLFGQELAARQALLGERIGEQERQYQQLFNLAQLGQAAAAGQAAGIQSAAGNIGGLLGQQANALAAAQVGAANAQSQMFQGLLGAGATLGAAGLIGGKF